MSRLSDRWFIVLTWLAALVTGLALARLASIAGLDVQRNYNEGWNAYHALAAMGGGALYPRAPSMMVDNYPPLSFFVTGWLGKLIPDLVVAGRIISLLSTLIAAAAIFAIARAMAVTRIEALFAAALFLAKLLAASVYVGINDPQMLGHALGCLGFLAAIAQPPSTRRLALSALLLTLAMFVKHMLVVQPLALLIWFAWYDRKSALGFGAFGILFAALGLVLTRIALGVDLFDALATPRLYQFSWLLQSLEDFLLVSFAPLAAGLYLFVRSKDRFAVLCGLYTLLAFIIGLLFDGGAGVGRNALFDAAIGGALCAALLVHRLRLHRPVFAFVFALACLVPPLVAALENAKSTWLTRQHWLRPLENAVVQSKADVAFIRNRPGPAMCERLAVCYWAGKAPEVDAFNFVQAVRTHQRDEGELTRLVEARYFSTIEMRLQPRLADLPQVMKAITRNYRVARRTRVAMLLIPREPAL